MEADFFIRAGDAEDAPAILGCLSAAFEPFRSSYTRGAWLDTVLTSETLQQRLSTMTVLVAVSAGEGIVGTISFSTGESGEGHLRGMAVLPAWQGMGAAEALLETAEAELRSSCKRITLDTTEPLQRAMRFYEKHGYQPSGRISDFFGMRLHEYVKELG